MTHYLRSEFQVKHFGFTDCKDEQFYESQWSKNRLAFLIYRFLIFTYSLGWIIGDFSTMPALYIKNYWIFLTNWTEVSGCLYFLVSLMVAAYGFSIRNKHQTRLELKWFHKIDWILFSTVLTVALGIDIAYWVLLSRSVPSVFLLQPLNIHAHAINYILLLIDLLVNNIPLRLLHFIYLIGFGLVYTIFTVILWAANYTNAVYPGVLDWETNPGRAALVTMLMSFVVLPLLHFLWHFWLYRLKTWLAKRFHKSRNKQQQLIGGNVEMYGNLANEANSESCK